MRHVNDERVGEDDERVALSFQLHYVRDLVPAEPDKSRIIFGDKIFPDNNVRLVVWFPLYLEQDHF